MKSLRFSDQDNETHIREALVAPLLRRLGYVDEDIVEEFPVGIHGGLRVKADYVVSTEHRFFLPWNTIVVEVQTAFGFLRINELTLRIAHPKTDEPQLS